MNAALLLLVKAERTIGPGALDCGLYRLRGMFEPHMIGKRIVLIKLPSTTLLCTRIGWYLLMTLKMVVHGILLYLYSATLAADIMTILVCFVFEYH